MAMQIAKVIEDRQPHRPAQVTPKIAIIMPAKPIIEPTDRSNSPAIINRQAPTAMIMNCAETMRPVHHALAAEHAAVGGEQEERR